MQLLQGDLDAAQLCPRAVSCVCLILAPPSLPVSQPNRVKEHLEEAWRCVCVFVTPKASTMGNPASIQESLR